MKDLEIHGVVVRVTKYKAIIFDEHGNMTDQTAEGIALYLREEGFIEKDECPVEIIKPDT